MSPRVPVLRAMVTLLAGVWASASALVAAEVDAGPRRNFELPAADATVTFRRFIAQAQVQVLYGADEIAGVQTNPVSGEMTAREAAERLVAGTRLRVSVTAPGAPAGAPPSRWARRPTSRCG